MSDEVGLLAAALAIGGLIFGLLLLARGFLGYGTAARIGDTATSRISSLAIGEVRVTGVVEPAGLTLVSPLQSVACVYYRSSIRASDGEGERTVLDDERAVGFRVRDPSGAVRVFPRGATFDVPNAFDDATSAFGETPPGLHLRDGSAFGMVAPDRAAQVAALLTVRPASPTEDVGGDPGLSWGVRGSLGAFGGEAGFTGSRRRTYREARIEPGHVVTVVGQVLPFDQLPDPIAADSGGASATVAGLADPEVAADLEAARAAGLLEGSAEEAWGNAAIPGFGIGAPVSMPELHPEATVPALAEAGSAERAMETFEIGPHDLVLAAATDVGLVIALGPPSHAIARHEQRFLLGMLGAVLAIASAVALAALIGGGVVS